VFAAPAGFPGEHRDTGVTAREVDDAPGPARDLTDLYRELRAARPMSYGQITVRTGLSKAHLSEVFNGRKGPSPDTAQEIAEALGATPEVARRARLHAERLAELNRYRRRNGTAPAAAGGQPPDTPQPAVPSPPPAVPAQGTWHVNQSGTGQMINNYGVVLGDMSIQVVQRSGVVQAFRGLVGFLLRLRLRRWILVGVAVGTAVAGAVTSTVLVTHRQPAGATASRHPTATLAARFQPLDASGDPAYPLAVSGTELTIHSATSFDHLYGAWLPGTSCTTDVSYDVRLDAPEVGTGGTPGAYGYAVGPQGTVKDSQPYGWSMDHRWDPPGNNQDGPGFFFAPVTISDTDRWDVPPGRTAPDPRRWHHVHAYTDGTVNRIEVDGTSVGALSAGTGCGVLLFRVWGGATAHIDHLVVTHPSAAPGR
jgi:transcriptional regulator with XRE-family HTH domain